MKLTVKGSGSLNLGYCLRANYDGCTAKCIYTHDEDAHPTSICIAHIATEKDT